MEWYEVLLYPDHIWGIVLASASPRSKEKGNLGEHSLNLSIRPLALCPHAGGGAGGEAVEEEGSWSLGPPRAVPGGRCEAWTMPAASGLRTGRAVYAPRPPARTVPRPGPRLTALHLAAFLGGRRVPHDWGDGKKGSGTGKGAGAVPATPPAEASPASARVEAMSAPGSGAPRPGGKIGPVRRAGFSQLLSPGGSSCNTRGGCGGGGRHSPFPRPAPFAPPARPPRPSSISAGWRAPEVTYGPDEGGWVGGPDLGRLSGVTLAGTSAAG